MADLQIKQNNFGFQFQFTVLNADLTPKNLSGYDINMAVWQQDASAVIFSNPCTTLSATGGLCQYTVQQTDFPIPGLYNAELQLSDSGYYEESRTFTLWVTPSL